MYHDGDNGLLERHGCGTVNGCVDGSWSHVARSENVMYVHWRPEFLVTVSLISLFLGCQNSLIKYDTSLAYKSKCLSGLEDFAIACHFAVLIFQQLSVEKYLCAKTKIKPIFQTPYPRQKGTRWNKTHIINRKGSIWKVSTRFFVVFFITSLFLLPRLHQQSCCHWQ